MKVWVAALLIALAALAMAQQHQNQNQNQQGHSPYAGSPARNSAANVRTISPWNCPSQTMSQSGIPQCASIRQMAWPSAPTSHMLLA